MSDLRGECVGNVRQVMPSTKAQELLEAGRRGSRDEEDFRAAERASKNLIASILGKKAAAPPQQFYGVLPDLACCHLPGSEEAGL